MHAMRICARRAGERRQAYATAKPKDTKKGGQVRPFKKLAAGSRGTVA